MSRNKITIGILFLTMLVGMALIPSAMASTEEQQTDLTKDAAQLKIEALEAELGEEGMKEVADYLELQASLPDVVKRMPYRGLAFAATDPESQAIKMEYIDNFDVSEKEKERYKAGLQDVWDRYPDNITEDDYAFMSELGPMIEKEGLKKYKGEDIGVRWYANSHQDFAYYACDGSAYRNNAKDAADDPDASGFELPGYRYYNHYWDADWSVGGAPGCCDAYAGCAQIWADNGRMADAHHDFGISSHYLSDAGNPFHSAGAVDQVGNFVANLFTSNNHDLYENYIYNNWNSGVNFRSYVSSNTQSITVTDPEQAVKDNADYSAQYYDFIWDKVNNYPNTFGSYYFVQYYTLLCVQKTAKYNHGLYDYIMT